MVYAGRSSGQAFNRAHAFTRVTFAEAGNGSSTVTKRNEVDAALSRAAVAPR